jgi:hypothetical protein
MNVPAVDLHPTVAETIDRARPLPAGRGKPKLFEGRSANPAQQTLKQRDHRKFPSAA